MSQLNQRAGLIEQIHHHLATARTIKPASQAERELLDRFQAKRLAFRAAVSAYDDETGLPLLDECYSLGREIATALHEGRIVVKGSAI